MEEIKQLNKSTQETYKHQLRPWVNYLETHKIPVSSDSLKDYLDQSYTKSAETYNKIGKHIVNFTNRNVEFVKQIRMTKKIKPKKEPFEMASNDLEKLKKYLKEQVQNSYDKEPG